MNRRGQIDEESVPKKIAKSSYGRKVLKLVFLIANLNFAIQMDKAVLGIFLDTETNGLNAMKHQILEIAFKIIDVRTGSLCQQFQSLISTTFKEWEKSDPASLQINGFSWAEISQAPSSKSVAEQVVALFKASDIKRGEAVFICQNPSFDRIFFSQLIDADLQEQLLWPYHWLDLASMYWVESLHKAQENKSKYPWETGCSKDKIASAMNLPKEVKPHRAMNGVDHLLLCYTAIVGFPEAAKANPS